MNNMEYVDMLLKPMKNYVILMNIIIWDLMKYKIRDIKRTELYK